MDGGKLHTNINDKAACMRCREYTETLKGALE